MIRQIYSSLKSFKEIEFHSGLNVLIAKKELGASDRQTRNRAGKTSLIEIVNFLMGADANPDSLFRSETLVNEHFGMTFDLGGETITVTRSGKEPSKIHISGSNKIDNKSKITNSEWRTILSEQIFGLDVDQEYPGRKPTFRSLFAYFVRRQLSGGFTTPEKQARMQQTVDFQVALLFLMNLNWRIASEWQRVRDQEKTLKELKKAAKDGALENIIGKSSDLRTQLTVNNAQLNKLKDQVRSFQVLPQYRDLEIEADRITKELSSLSNDNTIDTALVRDLETTLEAEAPPSFTDLESIYKDAGVILPNTTIKRYDEVHSFHESVIRNRKDYLTSELSDSKQRIEIRERQKGKLDQRRSEVLDILRSHGALEQFSKLQGEMGRLEAEVRSLRKRFDAADQLEVTKNELEIERNQLALRLRRDFSEQSHRLDEAILAFEEISKQLYESAGSMTIEETPNGPVFQFPMQGSRSKGIKNMQIFCFDLMLMRLCVKRGIGPGFLIHDSHLFDGVDGRQVISALKIGSETSTKLGYQYIITLNEDDAFKETIDGFDLKKFVLPVGLTDATDDGGLFGIRF